MAHDVVDPSVVQAAASEGNDVYPYAEYRPISEALSQPHIEPWLFMLHTMAGPRSTSPDALWTYFARGDIRGESHLILGYTKLIQAMPFTVRADNNYQANSWWVDGRRVGAVSVETQDEGAEADPGIESTPWNDYQLEHLAGVAAFLHLRYGIPLQRCANWDSQGVDGHRAHDEWSKYTGKTCPGQTRWEQIPGIIERATAIAQPQGEDIMSTTFMWHKTVEAAFRMDGLIMSAEEYNAIIAGEHTKIETSHPQTLAMICERNGPAVAFDLGQRAERFGD